MTKELESHHIQHEFVSMSDRGHGFDREMQAPDVAAAFDRVMAFLKKYLAQ
jgi:predicted GNAT family acetyltransferase